MIYYNKECALRRSSVERNHHLSFYSLHCDPITNKQHVLMSVTEPRNISLTSLPLFNFIPQTVELSQLHNVKLIKQTLKKNSILSE